MIIRFFYFQNSFQLCLLGKMTTSGKAQEIFEEIDTNKDGV
jgi:hypothetical protein